jgi:signal transduction histidine kinase
VPRESMLARLRESGSVRNLELQVRNRRGDPITILHSAELIELGGRMCVLRVSQDITERKRAEAEREQPVDGLFSNDAAVNLYRIVQECLNNILKHSQAGHVNLCLERDLHEVQLRIEDDGVGFNVEPTGEKKGLGLRNITERVRMLDGKMTIASSPGKGTRIQIAIPVSEPPGGAT